MRVQAARLPELGDLDDVGEGLVVEARDGYQ